MTVSPHKEVWVFLYFPYLFIHNKCVVVLTPSFISTHGHSHTKGCVPLRSLAGRSDHPTQGQDPVTTFELWLRRHGDEGNCEYYAPSGIETREFSRYTNNVIQLISSSNSGGWSRVSGSQIFNTKTFSCLFPQWYWYLLDWPTRRVQLYHAALMIVKRLTSTAQWCVLTTA
jgi:hypothetical protein